RHWLGEGLRGDEWDGEKTDEGANHARHHSRLSFMRKKKSQKDRRGMPRVIVRLLPGSAAILHKTVPMERFSISIL
ncbi:MAG: hypothetical protein ACK5TH_07425, partial [Prosthecobacter sp.]